MNYVRAPSWAKINLTLHVRGRRADGFHELESLVALVGLADGVTVSLRHDGDITIECSDLTVPDDRTNLAVRAAGLLREASGASFGVHVQLEKRIPAGAGLGGGSSNAATTLRLVNELCRMDFSSVELSHLGARLGSDVPLFCRDWPLAILRGRGDQMEPVHAALRSGVILAAPPIHSPTAAVYRAFSEIGRSAERPSTAEIFSRVSQLPEIDPLVRPEFSGPALMPHLFNDLEPAAWRVSPGLRQFAEQLRLESGLPFCMSGSGSAYFCLVNAPERDEIAARLRSAFPSVRLVSTCVFVDS